VEEKTYIHMMDTRKIHGRNTTGTLNVLGMTLTKKIVRVKPYNANLLKRRFIILFLLN